MKEVTYKQYGGPENLIIGDSPQPVPKDNEVLLKIVAVGLNQADYHLLSADVFVMRFAVGLFKPKKTMLGADIAGIVETVGKDVTEFSPGEEVFGDISMSGANGLAGYAAVPSDRLIHKPADVSFETAASLPMASVTALQALRDTGNISKGKKVLINGASGGVGTFAVQIAKAYGAEVTGVCSTGKMEKVKELGADTVIDYTKEDITARNEKYDIVVAVNGDHTLKEYQRCMTPEGIHIGIGGSSRQMFQAIFLSPFKSSKRGQKFSMFMAHPKAADLQTVLDMVRDGRVSPVIDSTFTLDQIQDAFSYLGNGHAGGKIIIKP